MLGGNLMSTGPLHIGRCWFMWNLKEQAIVICSAVDANLLTKKVYQFTALFFPGLSRQGHRREPWKNYPGPFKSSRVLTLHLNFWVTLQLIYCLSESSEQKKSLSAVTKGTTSQFSRGLNA